MIESLHREFVYLWYYFDIQFRQIFGYWVLGIFLGSCVSVFLKDKIHGFFRAMGAGRLGLAGIVPASLLGIASPLCMYGTIPLAASFSRSGMRDEWLASFMMCSILLNPQLIVYSTALGTTALIVRIVSCFFCGIAAGLLLHLFFRGKAFFKFDGFDEPPVMTPIPICFCGWQRISGEIFGPPVSIFSLVFFFPQFFSAMYRKIS